MKVQKEVRAKELEACSGSVWNKSTKKPITFTASCIRTYCQATAERSFQAKRHNTVAKVGHRVLQAKSGEDFLVDARSSNARVRNLEEAYLGNTFSVVHYTDDHSKWKPDKARGLKSKKVLLHMNDRQRAPYSDMKDLIPGVSATTSSHLYVCAPEASQLGTSAVREKRGVSVQKIPVAVQRLLFERPSHGLQQMNDHLYAVASHPQLKVYFRDRFLYKLKVTDGGADQNPRNEEVQFADTYDHVTSGRLMDAHVVRCAGLSPLNEAEHVNGAETSAVSMSEVPSMLAVGVPKTPEELRRNARAFGQAITNAISGGKYGGTIITSIYSHPNLPPDELQKSETIDSATRLAVRAINDKWPDMPVVKKMPQANQIVPVKVYHGMHSLCGHYSNQLSRFACRAVLGRLCCQNDYAPFGDDMPFSSCLEMEHLEVEERLCSSFIPDPKKKPDGHYENYEEVREAVAAGKRAVTYQAPPPSLELKRYFKEESQIPSNDEVERLARDVYEDATEKGREMMIEWFSRRRLDQLLKQEEKRKAALDAAKSGAVDVEATVVRIVDACAEKVAAVRTKAGLYRRSHALLKHIGTVSTSGSKDDMVRRLYDMREYIVAAYKLDEAAVYPPVVSEEDLHVCATCKQGGTSTNNPLLECVAQCKEPHYHMHCVDLDYMPGNWLCALCIAIPVFVIRHIIGKRMSNKRTEYQVAWVGHEIGDPEWQALRDIPEGSRYLVNGYNARLRREKQQAEEGGVGGGITHRFVGIKVAKDFSHGAVYVGYVTKHYPPELENGEMTEELFHVEYDDGDEEDMNAQEVAAAIALAE